MSNDNHKRKLLDAASSTSKRASPVIEMKQGKMKKVTFVLRHHIEEKEFQLECNAVPGDTIMDAFLTKFNISVPGPVFSHGNKVFNKQHLLEQDDFQKKFIVHNGGMKDFKWFRFWKGGEVGILNGGKVLKRFDCFRTTPMAKPIYVREAYKALSKIIMERTNSYHLCEYVLVTGTPGVGKTQFLFYLLYQFRNAKKKVVLTLGNDHFVLDEFPFCVTSTASVPAEYIYLFDPLHQTECCPLEFTGFHVITCSPDPKHIQHVKQTTFERNTYYMPLWNQEEIMECNSLVYLLDKKMVRKNFSDWGRVPSTCFKTNNDDMEDRVKRALSKGDDVIKLVQRVHKFGGFYDNSYLLEYQSLVHMLPTTDYKSYDFMFASPKIHRAFLAKVPDLHRTAEYKHKLVQGGNSIHFGNLYETHVLEKFTNSSGSFKAKQLDNDEIDIPYPTTYEYFIDEVISTIDNKTIYYPTQKHFPTVDAVYPPYLIQITAGKTHKIKQRGIELVQKYFSKQEWKFLFIIPTMRKKSFEISSGKKFCNQEGIPIYIASIDFEHMDLEPKNYDQ